MKRILLCCLILMSTALSTVRADTINWHLLRTKHFAVYYSAQDRQTAERAGNIAEKWRAILARKLKFEPQGFIPIYLYPERRSFSKAVGVQPSDETVGITHTELLEIRVDASGAFEDIARIIPHELVHVFISQKLSAVLFRIPLWMHEGLAKYLSDDWSQADADLLADAASGSDIMPLSQLTYSFPSDKRKRSIAYVESYSAISFMAKKYSDQSLNDLLDELKKGEIFPNAMKYSIGEEPDKFEQEWSQHLRDEYNTARWSRFGTAMVWVLMAVFAALAFRARKLQEHQKSEELEDEEDSSPEDE